MSKCVAKLAPVIDIDVVVDHCRMCSSLNFVYMLWFKFSFGEKFFKLVQFLFSFVCIYYHNLEQWQ